MIQHLNMLPWSAALEQMTLSMFALCTSFFHVLGLSLLVVQALLACLGKKSLSCSFRIVELQAFDPVDLIASNKVHNCLRLCER